MEKNPIGANPTAELFIPTDSNRVSSHDQDTIHAEKGCVGMRDFHMAALMFLTGHGIKAHSQLGATSEPAKHSVCGLMLLRL